MKFSQIGDYIGEERAGSDVARTSERNSRRRSPGHSTCWWYAPETCASVLWERGM